MSYKLIGSLLLFGLVIGLGSCRQEEDPIILSPDAGSNFLNIENDGYVVNLKAQPAPEGQKGIWRIYVGGHGRFEDATDPNSKFYGEPGENYVLGWELSQGDKYEAALINVSFKPLVPIILNTDQDTLYNNVSLYLMAEEPKFGATGNWEILEGDNAQILNNELPDAEFIGNEYSRYKVSWSLSFGSKKVSKELVFYTDKLRAQAGSDNLDIKANKNTNKFYTLQAFLPAGATGRWSIIGSKKATVHSPTDGYSLFEGISDTLYSLKWTVKLKEWESSDTVKVRFRGKWGMFTDSHDGQSYRFAEVNGLEWMAENYNYAVNSGYGSWYYGNGERGVILSGHAVETKEDRKIYGRLYDWKTAKNNAPKGWRLPTYQEFYDLMIHLGGPIYAGNRIKPGGDTGIDLNYSGYFEKNSLADPAYRNVFDGQEKVGMFWLLDNNTEANRAYAFDISPNVDDPGNYPLNMDAYGLSVRYVRDVQK